MRVLFVFPDLSSTVTSYTGVLSYGVALLSATLKRDGHETALYHITRDPDEATFKQRVRAARPDLVAFSVISHYAQRLGPWTTWAHEAGGAPVIVGGIHATFAPEEVSALPHVHYTCVGEGEGALADLCRALAAGEDPDGIPNLWVRRGDTIVRNPTRPIVADLDTLPDPDLSIFDIPALYSARQGMFTYIMSRGCAFRCTYCDAHTLMQVAPRTGKFWRFLSPERAATQLAGLVRRHMPRAEFVSFGDAIFMPNKTWLREFAPLYREKVGLPISCNMRADMVDAETADLLKEMGVRTVRMGVESGNERMTREVLKRHLSTADLRRAFALFRERGIERWSYNILGLPTETLPMALETARFNAEIAADLALAFIFYPYPGTELHRVCRERGFLTTREYDHYQVGVTLTQPQFRESDILFVHRFFPGLIRLYRAAGRLPGPLARPALAGLHAALAGPLLPRGLLVSAHDGYKRLRHRVGERLIPRAPGLYRLLGGRAPRGREGLARADA